jgi:hypothetical protein
MLVSLPHPSHACHTLSLGSDADSNVASFPAAGRSVSGIVKGRRVPRIRGKPAIHSLLLGKSRPYSSLMR